MQWLVEALASCRLTPEVEDYALGRGAKEETLLTEGVVTWTPPKIPAPESETLFRERYGPFGERLRGMMIIPVWSPRGVLIGFEGRSIHKKYITDYRLEAEKWNPFFLGLRAGMLRIWNGGDVWIGEGFFDKCPLEWIVPSRDAVLATVRASLSRKHVEFLRRYCAPTATVHMVYDHDQTGRRATVGGVDEKGKKILGALELLRRVELRCREVPYHGGKDPGEVWLQGGVRALKSAFT